MAMPEQVRPLRRVEYDKLVELGAFAGEKIELLEGALVPMSPIGPPHSGTVDLLMEILLTALHGRATVRIQQPFAALDLSEPEPDVLVAPRGDYRVAHPSVAHLVIEVAESSLAEDRGRKLRIYAECGVPDYWIVNLVDRCVEVHREPEGGAYGSVVVVAARGDTVALLAFPDVSVVVSDLIR